MKRSILLFTVIFLTACMGTSKTPVIYIAPNSSTMYTTLTFSPIVEFPNGIPDQANVVIRINGIDVTSEFDVWNNAGNNQAAISGQVDNGA